MTESQNPQQYWSDLKMQLSENEGFIQLYGKTVQLKLLVPDGKMRETDTANHKNLKGLKNQNLRDHMTDLELIFTMLGEASTTEIAVQKDAQGFHQNKKAAQESGEIAGNTRRELEQKSDHKVVSKSNFLDVNPVEINLIDEK